MPHRCPCTLCMQLPSKQALQPTYPTAWCHWPVTDFCGLCFVKHCTGRGAQAKPPLARPLLLSPHPPVRPSLPWCLFYFPLEAGSYSQPSSSDFRGWGRRTFCNSTGAVLEPRSRTGGQDTGNRAVTLELASWPNSTTLKLQSGHLGSI